MPQSSAKAPSPPFASREFNGEVLLEELSELRAAHVQHKQLVDCAHGLRELTGVHATEATARIKQLATSRFAGTVLATLLARWTSRLKSDVDVPMLIGHFERMALVHGVTAAMKRAAERFPKGGRG
jgi:hypothetical protein